MYYNVYAYIQSSKGQVLRNPSPSTLGDVLGMKIQNGIGWAENVFKVPTDAGQGCRFFNAMQAV